MRISTPHELVEAENMKNEALVVIDIQNDITKNYKEIIDNINQAIGRAFQQEIDLNVGLL